MNREGAKSAKETVYSRCQSRKSFGFLRDLRAFAVKILVLR